MIKLFEDGNKSFVSFHRIGEEGTLQNIIINSGRAITAFVFAIPVYTEISRSKYHLAPAIEYRKIINFGNTFRLNDQFIIDSISIHRKNIGNINIARQYRITVYHLPGILHISNTAAEGDVGRYGIVTVIVVSILGIEIN
jgi:hypothetical protein